MNDAAPIPGRRPPARGFTLMELMVVIVILGILSTATIPQYADSLSRFNADAAARRVKTDLEYLRAQARRAAASKGIVFNTTLHTYTLSGVPDLDQSSKAYAVNLRRYPYNAFVVQADCGGDATLSFDGYGNADSAATIVVGAGNSQRTIRVESSAGKVTLE